MAGLQRSSVSFRRQGSSGLIWDDKLFSGELNQIADQRKEDKNNRPPRVDGTGGVVGLTIERSRSNGFRTGKVAPAMEPPSPRVSACGLCGAFGKSSKTRRRPPKTGKRVA
ncbi:hypothetical protein ACP275_09G105100 [Erythranthe tilingii]